MRRLAQTGQFEEATAKQRQTTSTGHNLGFRSLVPHSSLLPLSSPHHGRPYHPISTFTCARTDVQCHRTQRLLLSIKAELENVTDLIPSSDSFEYFFEVRVSLPEIC